jgi:uncharacterized membrane protein YphA (DoxX/SURF4 family)
VKSISRYLPIVVRILMGLIFLVFGLNGFFNFIPAQPPPPERAAAFAGALAATGYMFPLVKGIEVLAGLSFLTNRFVPLGLTLLAPVVVNIFMFHTVLAPANPISVFVLVGEIYLAWVHRDAFRPLFVARSQPRASKTEPSSAPSPAAA